MTEVLVPRLSLRSLKRECDLDKYYIAHFQWTRLADAIERSIEAAEDLPSSHIACLRRGVGSYLTQRVCWFFQKVFVYELNQFTGSAEDEESFNRYLSHLGELQVQKEMALRYAPLCTRVQLFLDNFVRFVHEHVRHWQSDKQDLVGAGFAPLNSPDEINFGLGDPHRGAKSTISIVFGADTLYYKPRSLQLDRLFAEFQKHTAPWMKRLETIARDGYGWQKGIRASHPSGEDAARTFFRHAGSGLAILFLLSGTDFHSENLVSDDDGCPYFVDMEALFTNRNYVDPPQRDPVQRTSAEKEFQSLIKDSIFSVGLIPYTLDRNGAFAGIVDSTDATAPVSREVAVAEKRGNMHLRRLSESIQVESAVPRIGEGLANAKDFIDDLVDGFSSTMRLAAEHKVELRGLLNASSWHSRQIYRNTYVYFLFLAESTHPSIASKDDGFANLMAKLVREHSVKPFLSRTFDAELRQMYAFDIPFFSTQADGTAACCGASQFDDYFTIPVMSDIYRKIDGISEGAIDLHVDFLRRTYAAAHYLPLPASEERDAVRSIADTLASRAILGASDDSLAWMYSPPTDASSDKVAVTVLGPDLYSGMGGMLWFASEAAYALGDAALHALCRKVRTSVCMHLKQRAEFYRAGAMTGYQGLVWALAQDALRHGNHRNWMLWKRELCSESFFEGVVSCDVVDGLAGCVLQLLALHEMSADQELLDRAGELIRRVLAHARTAASSGLYWEYEAMQRPLLGFGHGGAGIAFAINAYARAVHDEALQEKVVAIFNFEDQYFNEKMGLWPDLRIGPDRYTTSWCNGLAGHVQARIHCHDVLTPRQREITVKAAEKLMFYAAEGDNDSLCHGTLGTVEVLREVAVVLNDPRFSDVADDVIDCIRQRGVFRSGWSTDQANPGVMVGISGYGITKLRTLGAGTRSPLTFMVAPHH